MLSKRRGRSLSVHFATDIEEVLEIAAVKKKGRNQSECKEKHGCIMGEPCPDPTGGDTTGEEEFMRYYTALTIRMRCAEHQFDRVNQQQARWRARKLKKKLDDSDDESHLGLVLRKRISNPGEKLPSAPTQGDCQNHLSSSPQQSSTSTSTSSGASSFPPQTAAGSGTGFSDKASVPFRRWWSTWKAARRAIPTTRLFRQSPAGEIHFQDRALNVSDPERIAKDLRTTHENADVSPKSWRAPMRAIRTTRRFWSCPAGEVHVQGNELNASECTCPERSVEELCTADESSDVSPRSPTRARLHRMFQWTRAARGSRSRVHVSFDAIMSEPTG
eukprot:TRINITY_DN5554_c0_g2_i1.p1 TRINITY_DN5554_c0_g2~~TRINITY_DN5554_c0_g2_i1.p1  ORF type:complete len:331 (+),score=22.31 TRINITY_DN5554_c0_g2_i1:63-1055(+)